MALNFEQIRRTADRVAASHGLDVVEIEHLGGNKQRVLRIFIERNREERARKAKESETASPSESVDSTAFPQHALSEGGALDRLAWVTHQDCEEFSRDFGTVLDVEELIPGGEYTLEVSSPGLDRKLVALADYERFKGSLVKVKTFTPVAGNRNWQGRIINVKDGRVALDLAAGSKRSRKKGTAEQTLEIAFADVEKANLVPEF